MNSEMIDTTAAAEILGIQTNRAALAIIKKAGIPIHYGKRNDAYVVKDHIQALATKRKAQGVRRGRPSRATA
jgi:hypothetical protein